MLEDGKRPVRFFDKRDVVEFFHTLERGENVAF